jgi:hypothetical protein
MITWMGIGHIFVGRILFGIVKLSSVIFTVTLDCFLRKCFSSDNYKTQSWFNSLIYLLYFLLVVWQVFDLVMIGLNKYPDGNGMVVKTWDVNQFK